MARVRKSGARRLEEQLQELGFSQLQMSERLGVSTSAISRWLSGKRRPSLEMAVQIEEAFGIPPKLWLNTG